MKKACVICSVSEVHSIFELTHMSSLLFVCLLSMGRYLQYLPTTVMEVKEGNQLKLHQKTRRKRMLINEIHLCDGVGQEDTES